MNYFRHMLGIAALVGLPFIADAAPTTRPTVVPDKTSAAPTSARKKAPKAPGLRQQIKGRAQFLVLGVKAQGPKTRAQRHLSLTQGQQSFALSVYKQLAQRKGNLVFSPISIATALSMVYAGARTRTARELHKALQLKLFSSEIHQTYQEYLPLLRAPKPSSSFPVGKGKPKIPAADYQISLANRLWTQRGFRIKKPYSKALREMYGSSFAPVNFKQSDAARRAINQWVSQATQQKIKRLLGPGSIKPSTRMVLTNAVYFKSAWDSKFSPKSTKARDFWLDTRRKKQAPTMHQSNWFGHKDIGHTHVVKLPYYRQWVSLYILIPKAKEGLATVEKALTQAQLDRWLQGFKQRYLSLYLPKFKFTTKSPMRSTLQGLGARLAFSQKADFSGISSQKLSLGDVIHQAMIDVHEKGTEAAAATAVTFMLTSLPPTPPPPIVIKADRPFLFVMRHEKSGALLFVGRVVSP